MSFRLHRVRVSVFYSVRVDILIKLNGGYFRKINLFYHIPDSLSIILFKRE